MAIMYKADLSPTKSEIIAGWLPRQSWLAGRSIDAADIRLLGSFRFDDPDGEVGLETHIAAVAGSVAHVPLAYRGAPLDSAKEGLLGTMDHSVLGKRWIYDAAWDPVYWTMLAATILDGLPQAEQFYAVDGGLEAVDETVHIESNGSVNAETPPIREAIPVTDGRVTTLAAGELDLTIDRLIDLSGRTDTAASLSAIWPGQTTYAQIAAASAHTG